MKKTILAALAIASIAAINSASAQTPAEAVNRSLFLGFQATDGVGSNTNIIVNIGLPTALSTLNLDISSALSSTYGANWYSRTDLYFGVIGAVNASFGGDLANTLYASRERGGDSQKRNTSSTQAGVVNKISSLANQYTVNLNSGQTDGVAVYMVSGNDDAEQDIEAGDWASFNPGTSGFDYFGNITTAIDGELDIYRIVPTSAYINNPAPVYSSGFYISAQGQAVPEPSTYALFGIAALLLIVAYRRANA
jgi:hypothetical protein